MFFKFDLNNNTHGVLVKSETDKHDLLELASNSVRVGEGIKGIICHCGDR